MCREAMTRSLWFNTRAIDHFPCFPVYHFFQLGAPYSTVLCHVDPLMPNALSHCLLPPPHSGTASMALCAHFLLQAPKPLHILMQKQLSCLPLGISRRESCNVPTPREVLPSCLVPSSSAPPHPSRFEDQRLSTVRSTLLQLFGALQATSRWSSNCPRRAQDPDICFPWAAPFFWAGTSHKTLRQDCPEQLQKSPPRKGRLVAPILCDELPRSQHRRASQSSRSSCTSDPGGNQQWRAPHCQRCLNDSVV